MLTDISWLMTATLQLTSDWEPEQTGQEQIGCVHEDETQWQICHHPQQHIVTCRHDRLCWKADNIPTSLSPLELIKNTQWPNRNIPATFSSYFINRIRWAALSLRKVVRRNRAALCLWWATVWVFVLFYAVFYRANMYIKSFSQRFTFRKQ